jgi:hypothetical protein
LGCVNGTLDYTGRTCSMYRRICTESELTAACGSERQSSPSTNCTKICTVRTPTQCFDDVTVCPPALVHVPPPRG